MTILSSHIALAVVTAGLALPAVAQVVVPPQAGGYHYVQDFNSLGTHNTTYDWKNEVSLPGWQLLNFVEQELVTSTYRGDTGESASGSFYSYGLDGDSDRAFGAVGTGGAYFGTPASGTLAGYITVSFRNHTGGDIGQMDVAFDGQQWRQGASDDLNIMVFEYGVGEEFGHVTWVRPGAGFDFLSPSPLITTPTGSAVYGRDPLARQRLGGPLQVRWPAGTRLWMRWAFLNNFGYDHGLAIDNFEFSVPPSAP